MGYRPINYVCMHSTPEMVKYMSDTIIDLKYKHSEYYVEPIKFMEKQFVMIYYDLFLKPKR